MGSLANLTRKLQPGHKGGHYGALADSGCCSVSAKV
jgi:hypothetical protein